MPSNLFHLIIFILSTSYLFISDQSSLFIWQIISYLLSSIFYLTSDNLLSAICYILSPIFSYLLSPYLLICYRLISCLMFTTCSYLYCGLQSITVQCCALLHTLLSSFPLCYFIHTLSILLTHLSGSIPVG